MAAEEKDIKNALSKVSSSGMSQALIENVESIIKEAKSNIINISKGETSKKKLELARTFQAVAKRKLDEIFSTQSNLLSDDDKTNLQTLIENQSKVISQEVNKISISSSRKVL